MYKLSLSVLSVGALSGCYAANPAPLQPLEVPNAEGAELSVRSQENSHIETTHNSDEMCVGAGIPLVGANACLSADYDIDREVTQVETTASIGDIPISYGQYLVLTDSRYDEKLNLLDQHRDACQASAVYEYGGMGVGAAGLITMGVSDEGSGAQTAGMVALGVGVATYLGGYLFGGGTRCAEGQSLYFELDHARHADTMMVTGESIAREMQAVAKQFNLRQRQSQARR